MAIWVTKRGETRSGSWKISLTPRPVFYSRLPGKNGVRNRRRVKNLRRLIQSVESPKTRQSPKGRRTRVALFNASRIAFFRFSFPSLHRFSVSFPERFPLFLARAEFSRAYWKSSNRLEKPERVWHTASPTLLLQMGVQDRGESTGQPRRPCQLARAEQITRDVFNNDARSLGKWSDLHFVRITRGN